MLSRYNAKTNILCICQNSLIETNKNKIQVCLWEKGNLVLLNLEVQEACQNL